MTSPMQSEPQGSRLQYVNDLSTTCPLCQLPSDHLAFIERNDQNGLQINEYHHCKKCRSYAETQVTANNYKLFWLNVLSKRTVNPHTQKPYIFDEKYGAVLP